MSSSESKALKLFISYSTKDAHFRDEIIQVLAPLESQGKIVIYSDKKLNPGDLWKDSIKSMVKDADIYLFLVSPDSLLSTFIMAELKIAIEKYRERRSTILPILIKDCNFKSSPLNEFFFVGGPQLVALDKMPQIEKERIHAAIFDTILNISQGNRFDKSFSVYEIIEKAKNSMADSLNLSNCDLESIPSQIASFKGLKTLLLNNNRLTEISALKDLYHLENLYLSSNDIKNISPLNSLTQLKFLDLSNNNLKEIYSLTSPNITHLYLKNNQISSLPSITVLHSLIEIDLSGNLLENIPGEYDLPSLQVLNLSQNKITKIEGINKMVTLKELNFANNKISKIENLGNLKNLEILDLYGNEITRIENLNNLNSLKILGLSKNKLQSLKGIEELKSLRTLYAAHNYIKELNPLGSLKKIERVILTANQIGDLFPLSWFFKNNFDIKYEFSFDPAQKGIFVRDNPIEFPPIEILNRGNADIIRYLEQQDQALKEQVKPYINNDLKIILIGNPNVGKSHLAEYITSHRMNLPATNASTKGMITKSTVLKNKYSGKDINVTIFDFGGQEYYHDTHHLFFTTDTVYLLLWEKDTNIFNPNRAEERYDPTNKIYIREINTTFPLEYWLDAVHYFCKKSNEEETRNNQVDPALILVETKRPKNGITVLDTTKLLFYSSLIHSQQAININFDQGSISGTGGDAFFDSLDDLVNNLTSKKWPGFYKHIVDFFINIIQPKEQLRIQEIGIHGFFCSLEQGIRLFNSIMGDQNLKYQFDEDNAKDLCNFLANRGKILYFENMEFSICLYPQKLTEEIYKILNSSYSRKGFIDSNEAKLLKSDVLDIMILYKLIISDPLANGYIVPQLLPDQPDQSVSLFISSFKPACVRYEVTGFIHKSLVQNLYSAFKSYLLKSPQSNYFWKNGFLVKLGSNEVYLISFSNEYSNQNRYITIQYLNRFISSDIDEITSTIELTFNGRIYPKEISLDGLAYLPLSKVKDNIRLENFTHQDKTYRVADFKSFLKENEKKFAMKKLFISYSSRNTDFKDRFITHLAPYKRNGMIDVWHDRDIETGEKWEAAILAELDRADLIIFLLSPDFINTNYIFDVEIPKALERYKKDQSKLYFIELKSCQWKATILNEFMQNLEPKFNGKKLVTVGHPDNEEQWTVVIDDLVEKIST